MRNIIIAIVASIVVWMIVEAIVMIRMDLMIIPGAEYDRMRREYKELNEKASAWRRELDIREGSDKRVEEKTQRLWDMLMERGGAQAEDLVKSAQRQSELITEQAGIRSEVEHLREENERYKRLVNDTSSKSSWQTSQSTPPAAPEQPREADGTWKVEGGMMTTEQKQIFCCRAKGRIIGRPMGVKPLKKRDPEYQNTPGLTMEQIAEITGIDSGSIPAYASTGAGLLKETEGWIGDETKESVMRQKFGYDLAFEAALLSRIGETMPAAG